MDVGNLIARARGLLDSGQYTEAVHCLESAVRRQARFPDLQNLLGLALSLAGEPLRAEMHLKRAVELQPALRRGPPEPGRRLQPDGPL